MKTILKVIISFLLLFNGIGALYGGGNLILHPDGSSIQLSMEWLKYTSFQDYFIPGIILFTANGVFSILVFVCLVLGIRNYSWLVMIQGAILFGWIVIQMILTHNVYFLHFLFGGVGIVLMLLGWILTKQNTVQK